MMNKSSYLVESSVKYKSTVYEQSYLYKFEEYPSDSAKNNIKTDILKSMCIPINSGNLNFVSLNIMLDNKL